MQNEFRQQFFNEYFICVFITLSFFAQLNQIRTIRFFTVCCLHFMRFICKKLDWLSQNISGSRVTSNGIQRLENNLVLRLKLVYKSDSIVI